MSISGALTNIAQGVTGFFGTKNKDATYRWVGYLNAFLTEQNRVLENQYKWCLNPGYSFSVRGGAGVGAKNNPLQTSAETILGEKGFEGAGCEGSGSHAFSEFKFNVNPSELTFREPFAIDVIPTQTGYAVQHSGCVMRDIIIAGTTAVHPGRGSGGVTRGTIGGLISDAMNPDGHVSESNPSGTNDGSKDFSGIPIAFQGGTGIFTGERPGYVHFHLLRNYLKAYVQLKADPSNRNMQLVFNNIKDGESWIVEPVEFTMNRTSRMPISYQYQIVLRALQKTPYMNPQSATNFGIFGQFIEGIKYVERVVAAASDLINIGAGIINQGVDYLRQIEQGVEELVLGPIRQVSNVLSAVSNGVNTVSALPRTFYTNLQIEVSNMEDIIADIANMGDDDYNVTFGRVKMAAQRTTPGFTPTEYDLLRGLDYVVRGLTLVTSNDLFFSNPISEPLLTTIDTQNTNNSINLSTDQKMALRHTTNNGIERMFNRRMTISVPKSVRLTTIRRDETLEMISLRTLGDSGRWTDLAILNGLKFPYIETSGDLTRGTLSYGDKIYIPSVSLPKTNLVMPGRRTYITRDMTENEKNLGVDLQINEDKDLRIGTNGDLDLIAGAGNAVQCIQLMLSTEKGDLKYHPYRGIGLQPGITRWQEVQDMLTDIRTTITSDSRFNAVTGLSLIRSGSAVFITMTVSVTEFDEAIPLQLMI